MDKFLVLQRYPKAVLKQIIYGYQKRGNIILLLESPDVYLLEAAALSVGEMTPLNILNNVKVQTGQSMLIYLDSAC